MRGGGDVKNFVVNSEAIHENPCQSRFIAMRRLSLTHWPMAWTRPMSLA